MLFSQWTGILAFVATGSVIVVHHPQNRIGLLCLWAAGGLTLSVSDLIISPCSPLIHKSDTLLPYWAWFIYTFSDFVVILPLYILLPSLFPTGRFLSPAWANMLKLGLAVQFLLRLPMGILPDLRRDNAYGGMYDLENPFGITSLPDWWYPFFRTASLLWLCGLCLLAIVSIVVRWRRATGDERQQIKWLAYFLSTAVTVQLLFFEILGGAFYPEIFYSNWYEFIMLIVAVGLPTTLAIAIFKYRLYDIDLIINRTLVYGTLTVLISLLYLLMVVGSRLLIAQQQGQIAGLALTIPLMIVLFAPLKNQIQLGADRLVPIPQQEPSVAADPDPVPSISYEHWLSWAKLGVGLHTIASLVLFVVGTSVLYETLTTPCEIDCRYFLQLQPSEVVSLSELGWTLPAYAYFQIAQEVIYLITFSLVAGIIYHNLVRKRTEQTWFGLLTTFALMAVGTILLAETSMSVKNLGANWTRFYDILKASAYVAFISFCLLFPDGRFVPRWTRWMMIPLLSWMAMWVIPTWTALDPAEPIGIYISLGLLAMMVGGQIYRYRWVSDALQRQQTKWFVYGFAIVFAAVILWSTLFITLSLPPGPSQLAANLFGQGMLALFPVAFAVCIIIALLRYRLWDIDVIINRTLVYGALTTLVVGLYALIVSGTGLLFHSDNNLAISLLATGIIAVLFQPARAWLQTLANRWLFGERDDPAGVLTRLTSQLERAASGDSLLDTLVKTIASSLKLPYVALWLDEKGGQLSMAAETGTRPQQVATVPLLHQQERVGQLDVAPRSPGEALSQADQQLLAAIARLTATTARTIQLTDEVQEARIRTVSAREEERRRLRRDLHDGLGPVLASQGLKLAAARQLLRNKPEIAEQLLDEVMSQSENTVGEVRRLVYALRPPTLDEFGLVGAIREHVETVGVGLGVQITVDAPAELPPIPAAIEVAAFRIVQEALNNVLRHANAGRCVITVQFDTMLTILVEDNGTGFTTQAQSGVGLQSMHERAVEVGGTCTVENRQSQGVTVRLMLPLASE